MPTCPDPATLFRWRDTMAQAGGALLAAVALFAVVIWAMRPSGWPLRLAVGLSAALALGGAVVSFIIRAQLDGAAAQVARWFPYYPNDCTPGTRSWPPGYLAKIQQLAQQTVAPLERAAAIDLAVAVVALLALVASALLCVRAAGRRAMTTISLDS